MYHAVEAVPRPPQYKHFYVTAKEFAGQIQMLQNRGYTAITFDLLARAMAGEEPLPHRPVVLTFDDGYANLIPHVHPLLRRLGFPYTVFLVSEKMGGTNDWVAAEGYEPTPLLTWEKILQMQADGGVDFQAHTATHRHLNRIPSAEARQELAQSKDALEQKLGKPMTTLCYPYGSHDATTVALAQECGYQMAVTTEFGRVRMGDDPLRLPRISVYHVPPVSLTYGIGSLNFRWRLETRKDTRV
jgi:peptidoglycan/xylan/chitin deacetylase (PgdA/CDA1 family)